MATIGKMNWWTSGGGSRGYSAAQLREAKRRQVVREGHYAKLYAELADAIMSVSSVELAEEVDGYMRVSTAQTELHVHVHHPEEVESLSGESYWAIDYGNFGWGMIVSEAYPDTMSAKDIAFRVDFLVNLINPDTKVKAMRTKWSARMTKLYKKITSYTDATKLDPEMERRYQEDRAKYA